MKQALEGADPQAMQRVKDMMRDLNDMLDADARGEDTTQQFADFMERYGDFFPDNPQNLEELVDSLARRAAAAQRMMNSLSPEQQAQLAELMSQVMQDSGLAGEMGRLSDQLRARRPELDWSGRERMRGDTPLGLGETALRRIFDKLEARGRGDHDMRDAGAAGDPTGATRLWQFGDEQPIDVVRTVRNAIMRQGGNVAPGTGGAARIKLHVDDFE